MRAPRLRSTAREGVAHPPAVGFGPVAADRHDIALGIDAGIDAQRLLLPALHATLAGLRGRPVLDIGGRAGLIGGTPIIRATDPLRLPWPDAYFDAVLSLDLLGLLAPDELQRHVVEAARVLRPGGRLICVVSEQPDTVFTFGGMDPDLVRRALAAALAAAPYPEDVPEALLSVPGILRATAIRIGTSARIPDPDHRIVPGTLAWTRLADGVVRHRIYGVEDLVQATTDAPLSAVSVERHVDPTAGRVGSTLGSAYRTRSPFAMVHLVRRTGPLPRLRPRFGRVSGEDRDATTLAQ